MTGGINRGVHRVERRRSATIRRGRRAWLRGNPRQPNPTPVDRQSYQDSLDELAAMAKGITAFRGYDNERLIAVGKAVLSDANQTEKYLGIIAQLGERVGDRIDAQGIIRNIADEFQSRYERPPKFIDYR